MSARGGSSVQRVLGGLALLVLRLALAGLFAWAAWVKLQDPRAFYFSIKGFQILPEHMLEPLAFMVPWTELVCAAALVLGFWARSAAIVLGAMLMVFIAAILSVLMRDMHVECGCFGDFAFLCPPGAVGWCNIAQNALMFLLAFPVMAWGPGLLAWNSNTDARTCCGGSCACHAEAGKAQTQARPAPAMDSDRASS
ncbi:MAG: DoxX family membrane protein [Phycisphaerales bacterium]|nr:DoxX family membrane protein [Phycisphaerales bacterium]